MSTLERRTAVVEAHEAGQTLAAIVRQVMDGLPWSKSRQLVSTGRVIVDGAPIFDPTHRVEGGETVEVQPTSRKRRVLELEPERILHIDHDIVIVNKPSGISTAPYDESEIDTVQARTSARLALTQREKNPKASRHPSPLYVVQRLDKETTGVLVFARNRKARKALEDQLRKRSVKRRYVALAAGRVKAATIQSNLIPDRGDGRRGSWKGRGKPPREARRAITHVHVEEQLNNATLISCELETGRRHQIRIHLAEAGAPLLGEKVYARTRESAPRCMLHADLLGFRHPSHDRWVHFRADPPADFATLLEQLRA